MRLNDLIKKLEAIIPLHTQYEWDNCGIQITTGDKEIHKVLTALEITEEVIDEALRDGCDMIITHHPMIFMGIKKITPATGLGRHIIKLMEHQIPVYSCHTNFDKISGGNNDFIANLLGLEDISFIAEDDITRKGRISSKTVSEIAKMLAQELNIPSESMNIVGSLDTEVDMVGMCTGAGSEYIAAAKKEGCGLFITGDLKHHEARDAEELGICVIDAGHYGTEKIFPEAFIKMMDNNGLSDEVEFIPSSCCKSPFNKLK